ncbi:hypothetical protein H2N74_03355 [Bacillus velezensis]|nr:hypothetical protein H2N74_03355 [Bacillus velezensis]TNU83474.1 hypothetical protein FIA57_13980 [Bacillus velezensis]
MNKLKRLTWTKTPSIISGSRRANEMKKHTIRTKDGLRVDFKNAEKILKEVPEFLEVMAALPLWDELSLKIEGTTNVTFTHILSADVEYFFDEESCESYLEVTITSSPLMDDQEEIAFEEPEGEK